MFEGCGSGFRTGCPSRHVLLLGLERLALALYFYDFVLFHTIRITRSQFSKKKIIIAPSFSELKVPLVKCCDNVMISGRLSVWVFPACGPDGTLTPTTETRVMAEAECRRHTVFHPPVRTQRRK